MQALPPSSFRCLGVFVILANALFYSANATDCVGNVAGVYSCSDVNLSAILPASSMEGSTTNRLSDIWGWTDPSTGSEYALVGLRDGTAFVDVSIQNIPIYIGFLEAHDDKNAVFRDIKTYGDYAYIVADAFDHGMQIFDLTQLRDVDNVPVIFEETAHFDIDDDGSRSPETFEQDYASLLIVASEFNGKVPQRTAFDEGYAHNIAINEDSGYAYLVGTNNCNGGLFILDLSNRRSPTFAGCFGEWGAIHDAQCVTYDGPDGDYSGREICFVSYYIGVGVIDVTNKSNPQWIDFLEEGEFNEIEQGWLTEDQRYFLVGDRNNGRLRTYIIDVSNLNNIRLKDTYTTSIEARHSNNFVKGNYLYQANHRAGYRILDLDDISSGELSEVGFFDTTPSLSGAGQDGVWGVYPFFDSGAVLLSSVEEGLFIVTDEDVVDISLKPSSRPSRSPSRNPSSRPSSRPSSKPSRNPSSEPSKSSRPSSRPSRQPSARPSKSPQPSRRPSRQPSKEPSISPAPSNEPSLSLMPSTVPSIAPTRPCRFIWCRVFFFLEDVFDFMSDSFSTFLSWLGDRWDDLFGS